MTQIMDAQYEINATHIDLLRDSIQVLAKKQNTLEDEYHSLKVAQRYMNQLIGVLKNNVGLQEDWNNLLALADLDEPSWRTEYELSGFDHSFGPEDDA